MRSIQISVVDYEMLVAIAKKVKRTPKQVIEEFIKSTYYTL
tara:strand:- start:63 stop:185 length:123 start_codon:yes stop_codon:yes gene_type:complete